MLNKISFCLRPLNFGAGGRWFWALVNVDPGGAGWAWGLLGIIFTCRVYRKNELGPWNSPGNENVLQFLLTCFLTLCFALQIQSLTPEYWMAPDKPIVEAGAGARQDLQWALGWGRGQSLTCSLLGHPRIQLYLFFNWKVKSLCRAISGCADSLFPFPFSGLGLLWDFLQRFMSIFAR